jgi:hypothetical protein
VQFGVWMWIMGSPVSIPKRCLLLIPILPCHSSIVLIGRRKQAPPLLNPLETRCQSKLVVLRGAHVRAAEVLPPLQALPHKVPLWEPHRVTDHHLGFGFVGCGVQWHEPTWAIQPQQY